MYKIYIKRAIDVLFSGVLLVILSPLLLLVIILLTIFNKGEVFFLQKRPGRGGEVFKILKFKTMNNNKADDGELLSDSLRLTPIGRVIRKTSFDEVPQLLNVLIGDMSLIGPRPLLLKYLPYYNNIEKSRHSVRPGITGLAQINGRNCLGWNERLKFDIYYVNNLSFKLDAIIFLKTIKNIFKSKDIVIDPSSAMLDFDEERKVNPDYVSDTK